MRGFDFGTVFQGLLGRFFMTQLVSWTGQEINEVFTKLLSGVVRQFLCRYTYWDGIIFFKVGLSTVEHFSTSNRSRTFANAGGSVLRMTTRRSRGRKEMMRDEGCHMLG